MQHYNTGLDGDMTGGIVPEQNVSKILKDPLGLNVLINDSSYANPNRYFAHYVFINIIVSFLIFYKILLHQ